MPRSRSRSLESRIRFALELRVLKLPALAEHLVDQGGFAVVDMGDDRDIADGFVNHCLLLSAITSWARRRSNCSRGDGDNPAV